MLSHSISMQIALWLRRTFGARKLGRHTSSVSRLRSKVSGGDLVALKRTRRALQRDATLLQAIKGSRSFQRLHNVLLDNDQRGPLADDLRQLGIDVLHNNRREA